MRRPQVENGWLAQILAPLLVGILFLAIWEAIVTANKVPPYILPTPSIIARTLIQDREILLYSLWKTLEVAFLAFVIATILGSAIALIFVQSKWLELSLFPYAVLMQVTPIVAIAPLIIIWVRDTEYALTICAVLVAIFPVISNTTLGLRSIDPTLLSLFRMYRASRWQQLMRLRIPSSLPYFFGGLRISSGLALIGAVVAEFVAGTGGTNAGLAYLILRSGFDINIPRMFAALTLIALTGILLFATMVWISNLALRNWHESALRTDY
jgi:NitT/TauT family transport system permease protein